MCFSMSNITVLNVCNMKLLTYFLGYVEKMFIDFFFFFDLTIYMIKIILKLLFKKRKYILSIHNSKF